MSPDFTWISESRNRRIFLAGPFPGIGIVGRIHSVRNFECIDITPPLDQAECPAISRSMRACSLSCAHACCACAFVSACARNSDGSHVVLTRAGTAKAL